MTDPSDMQRRAAVGFLQSNSLSLKIHRLKIKTVMLMNTHLRSFQVQVFLLYAFLHLCIYFLSYLIVGKSKNVLTFSSQCHLKQTVY